MKQTILLLLLASNIYAQTTAEDWFKKAMRTGDNEPKAIYCSKAIELDSTHAFAYLLKAYSQINTENLYENSLQYLIQKATQYNQNEAFGYAAEGVLNYGLKKYEKALGNLNGAIQVDSSVALYYNFRGAIKRNLSKDPKPDYLKAIALDPNYPATYYNLGISLKNDSLALIYFQKCIEIDATSSRAIYFLGDIKYRQKKKMRPSNYINYT